MSTAVEKVNGTPGSTWQAEPRFDPRELAEAEAIRARTEADAEAARIRAEAEAESIRTKAAGEAEKQRLANERNKMRAERERADHAVRMAETERKREETERAARAAREAEAAEREAVEVQAKETAVADNRWRTYALVFYIVCAIVALPVQVAAFWSPSAPWLIVAPVMLEGGAWVVLKGAAAAVANRRPHWHYRLIAWCLAFIAAAINLWHGLHAFDVATAVGTAFASVAGPGVWDLHEHGRIRTRDGKLTRAEQRAQRAQAKREAAEKAAAEKRKAAEQEAREKAAEEAAEKLAAERGEHFPKVWEHALRLAAALGETTVTEGVWRRAWKDIEGTDPGDSVDTIRVRNAAARRVSAARSEAPGQTPMKVTKPQADSQMPRKSGRGSKTGPPVRGVRRRGDTPKYVSAAARQASIAAKQAADSGK